jgi:Zn-dependent peptidase ImmA (M78 family)
VRNKPPGRSAAAAIEAQVEKVLRGLGNPEPPLLLEQVRELQRLDRYFYTTADNSPLREFVSRIRVGARQVIERPMLMIDAAKALNLKAFYVPDRKRILIDGAVPKLKHRWIEAHEITHDLLPWHHEMMLGDTTHTLTVTCHEMLEGEANYGAGQLLFLRNRFVEEARASAISFDVVKTLKIRFGNTMTTTLWRYVESVFPERAMIGIVSVHPHPTMRPADFNPLDPCRYFIRSQTFANHFPHVTEIEMFAILESYCAPRRGGPLGTMEFTLTDANGDVQLFTAETFNQHEALTLAIHLRAVPKAVAVGGFARIA